MNTKPEVWLRGPVAGMAPLLPPAAHALIQTLEDVERVLAGLTTEEVWTAPPGAATGCYHR
jgi:hypothetical protein